MDPRDSIQVEQELSGHLGVLFFQDLLANRYAKAKRRVAYQYVVYLLIPSTPRSIIRIFPIPCPNRSTSMVYPLTCHSQLYPTTTQGQHQLTFPLTVVKY